MSTRPQSTSEARLTARLDELRAEAAWQNYERARAEVLRMKDMEAAGPDDTPSAYWREELGGFEYMLDATPFVIEKLRHHTHHVTGLRAYEYRSGKNQKRGRFERKLRVLEDTGGPALRVPESPALGGFGYEIDGQLYNVDTLKYMEVLVALERAGALGALRSAGPRPMAVEIGSGWGGFAYQLKSVIPRLTYVLLDLPELFLFSATYLMTVFPDARFHFWEDADAADPARWSDADFVFVPNTALRSFSPAQIDLAVNMVSFQEMTSEQVRSYVNRLADLGAPALYSLNRDRSLYNDELSSVRDIVSERYALEELDILPVSYINWLPDDPPADLPLIDRAVGAAQRVARKRVVKKVRNLNDYRHVIGRLRAPATGAQAPSPIHSA